MCLCQSPCLICYTHSPVLCTTMWVGLPMQVKDLENCRVMFVACGCREAQTLAGTENGHLYAWGDGSYGKLGLKEQVKSLVKPVMVRDFGKEGIAQLECGVHFSVLLTKSGSVYTW